MKALILVAMAVIFAATPCIAAEMPSVGSPPPLLSLAGAPDLTGKPYILVFFTSWSKPCEKEILALNELYKKHKETGLKVVGVSFDKKAEALKKFISDNKIEFDILIDKKLKSIDKYAILIIPTTFTIDRAGKISNIFIDYDDNVEKSIQEFIRTLTPRPDQAGQP